MSTPKTEQGARLIWQRANDPPAFRFAVRRALEEAGTVLGASRLLGVNGRNLQRWLEEEPGLKNGIKLKSKPGRPPSAV